MHADAEQLNASRKSTARMLCVIAALFVIVPCLGLRWLRAPSPMDAGMTLWQVEMCGEDFDGKHKCESMSNFDVAKQMRAAKEGKGAFAYAGLATLILSIAGGLALAAAGGLAFKDKFVREPVALTTVALLILCLALVAACVFIGAKPRGPLGVSWPFFVYAVGVVAGIGGAQLLSKAYSQVSDPYWDGIAPEPPAS